MYKKAKLLFFFTVVFLFISFFIISTKKIEASSFLPFGGKISSMIPCTCSSGFQVSVVLGKYTGTYLYDGAKLYSKYAVTPGKWALGAYNPGGVCMEISYPTCITLPITKGTILFLGVS